MKVVVRKWGNSAAVRIPAVLMQAMHLSLDEVVDVREEGGRIVIEPVLTKAYRLDDLVRGITAQNQHSAVDFGNPAGREILQMARRYVPDAGQIVWVDFTPQSGHEQAGRRPALVLSPAAYNDKTGLMVCCPMTSQIKGYPFEVTIAGKSPGRAPDSAVLADQVKSLDWRSRQATQKGTVALAELAEVRAKILALMGALPPAAN